MALQRYQHTGDAPSTTLNGSIVGNSTVIVVQNGTGYPDGSVGPFVIKIDAGLGSEEKVLCLSRTGNTINVVTSPSTGRGYDNTTATGHANGAAVEHCLSAAEVDDYSDHVYTTTRDDHTQYMPTNASRHFTSGVTINSGGLTVSGGGAAVTGNSGVTGNLAVTGAVSTALSGNTSRFVGLIAGGGAPTSGTYLLGDYVVDVVNWTIWVCYVGGTPGSWKPIGPGSLYRTRVYQAGALNIPTSSTVIKFDTTSFDPSASYSSGTGNYTCPVDGYYRVTSQYTYTASTGTNIILYIYKNGSKITQATVPITTAISPLVTDEVQCAAGDTLQIQAQTTSSGSTTTGLGSVFTYAVFERMG